MPHPDSAKVLIADTVYEKVAHLFSKASGLDCIRCPVDEATLVQKVKELHPVAVVLDVHSYTGPLYQAMNPQMLIARFGVGCDGIDFEQTKSNNIKVINTPGVLESTVAEFTVFLAGEVLRQPGLYSNKLKQGTWTTFQNHELAGKTWAVLGLGAIGQRVSKILTRGFGVTVHATKKHIEDRALLMKETGAEIISTSFNEVAPHADIISLHMPANPQTRHFLNRSRLQQLKPGAILINTARGALVEEEALYDMLESGHLAAAGLDVYEHEPYRPVDPEKDLRTLSNVVMTPHIASSSIECLERMAEKVIENIQLFIQRKYDQLDLVGQ